MIASQSMRRIARIAQILRCAKALAQDDDRTVPLPGAVVSKVTVALGHNPLF